MYANVRGIRGKRSCLIEHLHNENPCIFLLTETLLQTNNDLKFTGYTFFGRARNNGKGGGVGMLVRNDLKHIVTPHISDRPIEIIWISIKQKNCHPILIGCYYGKQESRCSKAEIDEEMNLLSEEIQEFKHEGEILMFMDGNGKIGLLGEEKSRNGKLLEKTFEEHDLQVVNRSDKCDGKITRQCTTNVKEVSAIDFVVANKSLMKNIQSMEIDEKGLLKIRGKKDSDHNTISVKIKLGEEKMKPSKKVQWRLNAPEECWTKFRRELKRLEPQTHNSIESEHHSIDQKYSRWLKGIENAARISIGKTTTKNRKCDKFSTEIQNLRKEKRLVKKRLDHNNDDQQETLNKYKKIQENLKNQILLERTRKTNLRLKKMTQDKTKIIFWKERKRLNRNETNASLTVKNKSGERVYDPQAIKQTTADYYEDLYAKKTTRPHPHHDVVAKEVLEFQNNVEHEDEWYNCPPTEMEIKEIINNKKNGKASTDLNNEIIKNGGE